MDKKEMPVFVKLDDYKDITDIINLAREKVQEAKAVLNRINDLKEKEDSEIESWRQELADIDAKISDIDKRLLEPEV